MSEWMDPAQPAEPAQPENAAAPALPDLAPPPAGPRPPDWRMLAIGVGIAFGFDIAMGVVYGIVRIIAGGPGAAGGDLGPAELMVLTLLSAAVTFTVIWSITCRRCGWRFAEGFAIRPVRRSAVAGAIGLALLGAVAAICVESQWGTEDSAMAKLAGMPGGVLAISAIALLLPPFEELYYRGFIFPIVKRYLGGWAAVALVTLWFAAAHALQLLGDPAGMAVILVMGLAWTLQRQITGSLVPSLIAHWLYNAALVASSLAFAGNPR